MAQKVRTECLPVNRGTRPVAWRYGGLGHNAGTRPPMGGELR